MDPDATIDAINYYYDGMQTSQPIGELFEALRSWLVNGGYRPETKLTKKARRALVKNRYGPFLEAYGL